jgi:Cyclic nucleotide-binding domain
MEKVTKHFESMGFGGGDLEKILDAFISIKFKKNDFVVEEGKVSKYIGFVESGLFQNFVIVDGMERTTYMNIENTFLASVLSFVGQKPAIEYIRALTDGKLSLISRANLQRLIAEIPGSVLFIAAAIAFVALVVDTLLTVKGNLPINDIINTWSPDHPTNWADYRTKWFGIFQYRQMANIIGFVCLMIGGIFGSK